MLEIDGNYLEGGGQIVRCALSLSALTGKPFRVKNIRAGREKPGLKAQHVHCVSVLEKLCSAKATDCFLGSTELTFIPGRIKSKSVHVDIGTAGSITLFLQCVVPVLLFGTRRVALTIVGGTDVSWSPSVDYFTNVLLAHLRRFGDVDLSVSRRGYYPKGKGNVRVSVRPRFCLGDFDSFDDFRAALRSGMRGFDLVDRGSLFAIKGIVHSSMELEHARVSNRCAHAAEVLLSSTFTCPVNVVSQYHETDSVGCGITLWALYSTSDEVDLMNPIILGSDLLGETRKRAEIVGQECSRALIEEIDSMGCVDSHLGDMLVLYMALLGEGRMRVSSISTHLRTALYVIEQFLDVCFIVNEEKKILEIKKKG